MELKDADGLGGTIDFPLNQQHSADNLGLLLVHTKKTLPKLYQLGLHDMSGGRLRLRNTKALVRLADYDDEPPKKVPLL